MLTSELVAYLTAGTACNAVFGGRYFHQVAPDNAARPFLIYQRIGGQRPTHLLGSCNGNQARIQITVWADDSVAAENAADKVRERLHGLIRVTMGSILVESCVSTGDDTDRYSAPQSGQPVGLYGVVMTFMVWHTESASPV